MKKLLTLYFIVLMTPVFSQIYSKVEAYQDGLALVSGFTSTNGYSKKYGYVDEYNKLVIPLKYEYAESFREGTAIVGKGIKKGLINKAGKEILPIKYDGVRHVPYCHWGGQDKCEAYFVEDKGFQGCVDKKGKWIALCEYDYYNCLCIYDGKNEPNLTEVIAMNKNGKWYLFSPHDGKPILPTGGYITEKMGGFRATGGRLSAPLGSIGPIYVFEIDGKKGLFDFVNKKVIVVPTYESLEKQGDFFIVGDGKQYGVIDKTGKTIVPVEFDKVCVKSGNSKCSSIEVNRGEKYGFFDGEGNVKAPMGSKIESRERTGGCGLISFGGKYGVIKEDELVLDMVFDSIDLSFERAIVMLDGKYGLVPSGMFGRGCAVGKEAIVYDNVIQCRDRYICKKDGLCGVKVIDQYGGMGEIYPFDYEEIEYDDVYYCYLVKQSGKWGIFDGYKSKGKVCYDTKPKRLKKEDCFAVKSNGKMGVVTKENDIVVPIGYDDIDYLGYGSNTYALKQNGKWGIGLFRGGMTPNISDFAFDEIRDGNAAIFPIRVDKKWGYVYWDYDNGIKIAKTIEPKYDEVGDFYEGKALVKQGKKEFYIDKKGKKVK